MAVSGITRNFTITDKKAAEAFADAMDKAAKAKPFNSGSAKGPLTQEELAAFLKKGREEKQQ